jgi:hypothetical protein
MNSKKKKFNIPFKSYIEENRGVNFMRITVSDGTADVVDVVYVNM